MKTNSLWDDRNVDERECFCTLFIRDVNGIYETCYKRYWRGKPWHAKLGTVIVSVGILHVSFIPYTFILVNKD